ncbi:FMN-dependent NADH-azoreductase [Mastigocoleus testarum]|uniref:FMN dependent NADH:quinone oxidoreductase n=1 Tax=Mastigocoleus testarum BC008 TaxID=371196 RepID=A0A0V7ZWC3_9CYAN|nr:NAD(P)H-dependent oxidoreductase [Mastigocoleus testarum]KST68519.1 FMN-dependent NADH-azoreductase [Mastigocoleus testarum BC008]KST68658.1 FMN-dependent NADH-azoreductase [Mastigocoleus testarum BC008]
MAHILHIDSSPRRENSYSRTFSNKFINFWKDGHPEDTVIYRDIGHEVLPYMNEKLFKAMFVAPEERSPELVEAIKISDIFVDEFIAANRYVFAIPMFNFNVPAIFKAYIDLIVRVNRTFAVVPEGYKGLLENKKMLIITSRGDTYHSGSPMAAYDFQEPYLRTIFGFIGITDITFIHIDSLMGDKNARTKSLEAANLKINYTVTNW